ncbi:MAG: hypothetical protein RIT41_1203 [Bacteroidota bacterium]
MNKVININFQGRILPIEEQAYEILKQYIESLRVYFENEEGRDEIINDIECRIAELCEDRLVLVVLPILKPRMGLNNLLLLLRIIQTIVANKTRNKIPVGIITRIFIEMAIDLKDYTATSKTKYWAVFVVVLRTTLS